MLEQRIVDRFWSYVEKGTSDECWPWKGPRLPTGYGQFGMRRGEKFYAHRIAFEVENGAIDPDLLVCHSCDNPPCCNGAHLFQGTNLDNVQDMWAKGRGYTPFGTIYRVGIGEAHPAAKLDAEKVIRIRILRAGGLKLEEIAAEIGVGKSTVSRVINAATAGGWAHIL